MARYEFSETGFSAAGTSMQPDVLLQLGVMYAKGRDCELDLVTAHKWLNIAAIRGSERAARLRAEVAGKMSKRDLAKALREAREWMTMH